MEEQTQPIITPHIYESYKDPDAHVHTIADAVDGAMTDLQEWQTANLPLGIPTGIEELDNTTNGWWPGELVVIAGKPSTGKTALALNMLKYAAVDAQVPSMFITLEASEREIARRLSILVSGLSNENIRGVKELEDYQWEQLEYALKPLSKAPIYIDCSTRLTTEDIGAKIQKYSREKGVRLIFIDDFQSISTPVDYAGNKEAEMTNISLELKRIAREQEVTIITIARLSRGAGKAYERTSTQKPQLNDLKDTSSLEYDADRIIFVHPKDYMGLSDYPEDHNKVTLILAKNRTGDTRDIEMKFNPEECRFYEPDTSLDLHVYPSAMSSSVNGDFDDNTF